MASERLSLPRLAQLARLDMRQSAALGRRLLARLHIPLLLLLALLLLTLAYQRSEPLTLAMGPLDTRFVSGANELERSAELGARWFRWTTSETRIDLPAPAAGVPLVLDLWVVNGYPAGTPAPTIDVAVDGRYLSGFYVEPPLAGPRHYQLLVPAAERASWNVPIILYGSTIELPADPRPIGVMLLEAQLGALSTAPLLPPLWQVVAMLTATLAAYLSMRGIGAARWLAWGIAALLAGGLALGLHLLPLHFAPYTMRLAGLLLLGLLFGLAVHLLSERRPTTATHTHPAPAARRVTLPHLALLMGLAFWLMPTYQLVMTLDGATNVTPYPPTLWLLLATAVGALFAVGLLADAERGQHWRPALLGLLGVSALLNLIVMIDFALGRSGPDFWILFRGARDWLRGGSMYNLAAVSLNHFGHVFKVPPFYGMLFLPFVEQDGLRVLFWHRIVNIALVAGTLLLLLHAYGVRIASALGVGLLLLFTMRPLTDTIAFGQIDILLLLLLALALVASQRGYDTLAGAAVALGALFKLYPALLLVFFVVKRQWWALVGFAAAMLLCNGIALAVVGWHMHSTYLFQVLPRIGGGTAWVENQTLNGFVSRLLADGIVAEKFDHPLVSLVTYGGFLLALAVTTLLVLRPAPRHSPHYMLQFGVFTILMVLTVPAAWMHYQVIVILPMFALLLLAHARGGLPRWQAALLAAAYALIAYGNQWSFYDGTIMGMLTVLGVSYKFYGLLLLLAVVIASLHTPATIEYPTQEALAEQP